eukprot:m.131761 g.131761  ORF g.131761 m.131761 type:complete len:430 (-) comp29565_c0_seq1:381-1670(-)
MARTATIVTNMRLCTHWLRQSGNCMLNPSQRYSSLLQCHGRFEQTASNVVPRSRVGVFFRSLSAQSSLNTDNIIPKKVLFFGTDEFALVILKKLHGDLRNHTVVDDASGTGNHQTEGDGAVTELAVVCPTSKGRKRGKTIQFPTATYAEKHGLAVHAFPSGGETDKWATLPEICSDFDVGVVVSFGHLIPARIIRAFRLGAINLHPSALPRYRGAAPIHHTILNGDTHTAVSVIELSEGKFDHGRILHSVDMDVAKDVTFLELRDALATVGADAVLHTVKHLGTLQQHSVGQDEIAGGVASVADKIPKTAGVIDWDSWSVSSLHRRFRAISHQVSFVTYMHGVAFRILELAPENQPNFDEASIANHNTLTCGTAMFDKHSKTIFVKCADGFVGLKTLQHPTKKPVSAAVFANGCGLRKHSILFTSTQQQ